jgi:serine protease SohB
MDYGLFLAKSITIIACIVLGLGALVGIISSRQKSKEELKIENLNDRFKNYQESLESEILSKEELKFIHKEKKKQEKIDKKTEKNKLKQKHKSDKDEPDNGEEEKPRLFVLRFSGDLHASEVDNLREEITAILSFAKTTDEVLVTIDSSGGIVHDYGFAASQLSRIRNKGIKLTVAVDLVAASGGYMMACVANHIIAAPFAIVGSIGVLAQLPNFNRLLNKYDIDIEQHTAGEYKTTLTILGKNTNKAREKFQQELEETHTLFKQFVKTNRPLIDINHIATGEYWYGIDALGKKLVDEIKTSDDYLMEKADSMDMYEITYQFNESFKDKISSMLFGVVKKSVNYTLGFLTKRDPWV